MLKNYTPEVYETVEIAFRKNYTTLLHAFNEKISEMKSDGTLYTILVQNALDKANMIFD